jgi:cytochrome P450
MNKDRYLYKFRPIPVLDSLATDTVGLLDLGVSKERRILTWDPQTIADVFRSEGRMLLASSRTLVPLVGETSMLFANGARHRAYRTVVGSALRGRRLTAYHDVIKETTSTAIDEMLMSERVCLPTWTRKVTLRIIGHILLGTVDDRMLDRFTAWVESALGSRRRTLVYRHVRLHRALPSPWRTFLRRRASLGDELLEVARRGDYHEASATVAEPPATLATLLTRGEQPLGALEGNELQDQIMSLLFAGHETTASATAWTLFWLERNGRVRHDLQDELAATHDDGSNADQVPLLDAVCREALRISPPAMVAGRRVLEQDLELGGRPLPKGSTLTPCIYLVHRRPDIYPQPLRFDPGRFLGVKRPANEYLPFGGGTRRCLGADLAMLELRMIVAAVMRQAQLRCLNPHVGVPHLRGPAMGLGPDLTMAVDECR